jgi:hypothetical protein
MQQVFGFILAPFKWLAGLLLPIFTRPRIPPAVYWVLHLLLLMLVLGGLAYLHHWSPWAGAIRNWMPDLGQTWFGGAVAGNFLIIFFVLVYVLAWLSIWLFRIWLEEDLDAGQFPDIDEAWASIQDGLHQNGIRLDDAPLFLVIGNADIGLDRLFKGLPREMALTGVTSATAPLRMFGGRDALYLAIPGVSLLSKALGFGPGGPGLDSVGGAGPQVAGTKTIGAEDDLTKSVGADAEEVARIMRAVRQQDRSVTEQERDQIRNLSMGEQAPAASLRPNVVQTPDVVSLQEERMHYFCRLLSKARWPFTPINGTTLVMSLSAAENEGTAQKIALAAQKDLRTLGEGLKLTFPVFVVLADLERWSGAASFLARFPDEKRKNRLGRGFALAPDVTPEQYPKLVERDVTWVFDRLLPFWCFRFFRLETPNIESPEEAVQANAEIFRFLAESQQRASTVGRMVAKAVQPNEDSVPEFGGCYVVAQAAGQPWFTQDLFAKVEGSQDFVAWTEDAFAENDDYRSWTWYGYAFLLLVWLAVAALAYLYYSRAK